MAEATTAPEAESPGPEGINFEEMSLEQMDQMLGDVSRPAGESAPAAEAVPEPEQPEGGEPPPEAEPEKPAAEAPKEPEEPAKTEDEGKPPQFRLRPNDFREAEVFRLMKEGKSLQEASREVYGEAKPQPTDPKPEEGEEGRESPPQPTAEYEQKVAEIQEEISTLQAQRKEATEELDHDKAYELTDKINDLKRKAERLDWEKERLTESEQARQAEALRQKAEADRKAAVEKYPTLSDPQHPDRQKFELWLEKKQSDEDYAPIFRSPKWRQILSREFADEIGLQAKAATPPKEDDPKPTPAPTRQAPKPQASAADVLRPAGTPPASSFEASPEMLERDIANMSVEEIDRLLGDAERTRTQRKR